MKKEEELAHVDTMSEGTDSRTGGKDTAGSEQFRLEDSNIFRDKDDAYFMHAEISIDYPGGGTHHAAVMVYGENMNARRRAKRIVLAVNHHHELVEALTVAAEMIPEPIVDGPCHYGICSAEKCGRCSRAARIYAALAKVR